MVTMEFYISLNVYKLPSIIILIPSNTYALVIYNYNNIEDNNSNMIYHVLSRKLAVLKKK